MIRNLKTVAPEIIACIGEDRDPTSLELARLADRVRLEIWGPRPLLTWMPEPGDTAERRASFRIAHVALVGDLRADVTSSILAIVRTSAPA